MLKALVWVFVFVGGVVALAVSVEKANQDLPQVLQALQVQLMFILSWLSPLLVALAISLSGVYRQNRGEQQALSCSGIGPAHLAPIAGFVGLVVALLGFIALESLSPGISSADIAAWMWTEQGPVRGSDGLLIPLDPLQSSRHVGVEAAVRPHPRIAPMDAIVNGTDLGSMTEQYTRLARPLACVGFALMGLFFGRLRQPIIWVASLGGAFTILDLVAWTMGAQGQLSPAVAGSGLAWMWCLPTWWSTRQPSTRNQWPLYVEDPSAVGTKKPSQ